MLGNPFALGMLIAVIALLFLARSRTPAARLLCLAATAAIPVIVAIAAVDRNSPAFGDVRLRVVATSFGRDASSLPAALGGSAAADDLYLEGLPPRLAEIRGNGTLVAYPSRLNDVSFHDRARWAEAAIVSVGEGSAESYVGAHRIGPGDWFCVESCTAAGATWYRVDARGDRLVAEGGDAGPLPPFRKRPLFPRLEGFLADSFAFYRPAQAIYPVRDYGRAWLGPTEPGPASCARRFVCDRATGQPVRSFLFRQGGSWLFGGGELHLALLDPGAILEAADSRRTRGAVPPRRAIEARASGVPLSIWQVVYAEADLDFTTADRPSYLIRRRSITTFVGPTRIRLAFARQPTTVIPRDEVGAAARRLAQGGIETPVALALAGALRSDTVEPAGNVIHLDPIGGALAAAIAPEGGNLSSLVFPHASAAKSGAERALPEPAGAFDAAHIRPGVRAFSIGDRGAAGERNVQLLMDRFTYPRSLIPVVAAWAILFGLLQAAIWRDSRAAIMLALVLQLMLLLRIFVAIGSAGLDPQIDYRAGLDNALIAYCLVPFALAWLFPARPPAALAYVSCGLMLIAIGAILHWSGSASLAIAGCAMLAGLAGLVRNVVSPLAGRLLRRARVALRRAFRRRPRWCPAPIRPWIALAVCLFLVRFGLFLLNVKERLGIALSVFYLPLSLYIVAGLFLAIRRAPDPRRAAWLAAWTALTVALLFVAVPVMVSDYGYIFIYLPPVLVIAIGFVRSDWPRWGRALAALPGAAALVFAAFSIITSSLPNMPPAAAIAVADDAGPDRQALLHRLAAATDERSDEWRLSAVFDPDRLNEAGTSAAEQIRRWRFLLANFTADANGRGFPYQADVSDLRQVQADDNVSAIHLMAPFGRSGTALFVLLLGVAAILATRAGGAPPGARRTAGTLALWTIFAAAAYMILANLVLLPFTGRNVYFLAAHSRSDLIEGATLIAMAYAAFVGRRARTPR